jgi:hypothetical protein
MARSSKKKKTTGARKRSNAQSGSSDYTRTIVRKMEKFITEQRSALPYHHEPRPSRMYAKLADMFKDVPLWPDPASQRKAKFYLSQLGSGFHLPRWYTFYPRNHSSSAHLYNEDPWVDQHFTALSNYDPMLANGFGSFNPDTGVFQIVTTSSGGVAAITAGPVVTLQTTDAADVVLTANILLDYQYTMTNTPNPYPHPAGSLPGDAESQIWVTARTYSGPTIATHTLYLKRVTLGSPPSPPGLPYFGPDGLEERSGTYFQDSAIALPVTYETEFSLPANSTVQVAIGCGCSSDADGIANTQRDHYAYYGYDETRLSGQVLSVKAMLYT